MQQMHDLFRTVLTEGEWEHNERTGKECLAIPGATLRFDLQKGFPIATTKQVFYKSAFSEMLGFLRKYTSAADFRALGTRVWDQNANENEAWLANPYREGEDDMGPIYGAQFRAWPAYKVFPAVKTEKIITAMMNGYFKLATFKHDHTGEELVLLYKKIDQIRRCLDTIIKNPSDRRILFHGWNVAQLEEGALAPCGLMYQFLPNAQKKELSVIVTFRSSDLGLGIAFNTSQSAMLLSLVARLTGYKPRHAVFNLGNTHIYRDHIPMIETQLSRKPYELPKLIISDRIPDYSVTGKYEPEWLEKAEPGDFTLLGYQHHEAIRAAMAV